MPAASTVSLALLMSLPFTTPDGLKAKPEVMPYTKLAPSKVVPDLCVVHYRITTTSPECQEHFDQGLGYLYSYVWMEAARSFETATRHDPECAMAWWGLSRALERWRKGDHNKAAKKADELSSRASYRERQLILARMQERGLAPNVGDAEARKKAAIDTLDKLLAVYDDDEEAWFYRAQLAAGSQLHGGQAASVPFYKALLHVNPLHPGANHELLHFYEKFKRPALGWKYAEGYIQSSPKLPHAFHMQAHLATRLGRWDKTTDRSTRAVELEKEYHRTFGVKPKEDEQFSHHLETLMLGLTHDGRFAEGNALRKETEGYGYKHNLPWFRLALAQRDYDGAMKIAESYRKSDKAQAAYLAAIVYLSQGDVRRARPEVEVLQQASQGRRNRKGEFQLWEAQGWLMCQSGDVDAGLKLLFRAVDKTKADYNHHAWGNGAYYMERWGIAALHCGKDDVAEEAFLEALAHDPGSVRGALGMQVLCERHGRTEEAARFAALAQKCWRRAAPSDLEAERAMMRRTYAPTVTRGDTAPGDATPKTQTPEDKR